MDFTSQKLAGAVAQKRRLYKDVEFLTEIRPFRNHRNLQSLAKDV